MSAPSYTLRPVTEADMPFLEALYASTRKEEMAQVSWPQEAIRAFLADQCRLQHHHYTTHYHDTTFDVVEVDGVPVGRLYLSRWPKEMRVVDVAILPEHRGRGLGRTLMDAAMEEADRAGLPLTLHVEQFNPAFDWYRRLGFRELATSGVHIRMERAPQPVEAHS